MAKRSKEQIREDEKLVIKYLTEDARQTPNEIAKKCGFSRQKSWRIIKRLEEKREIWGYTAIVDEEKMNETIFAALIRARSPVLELTDKLISRIKNSGLTRGHSPLGRIENQQGLGHAIGIKFGGCLLVFITNLCGYLNRFTKGTDGYIVEL